MDLEASKRKVAALTAPRNVVLVGASDRAGSWAARVWRNLNRYQFPGPIHFINPRRSEIWERPCYPDFKSLPEAPDHLVILVPAAGVAETLRNGAVAGARSATVFSAGFGEAFDREAAALGRELKAVIAETGLGVSGPNCMGNVCAKSSLVTLTEDRPLAVRAGPVALVGQSGGMMIFINAALEERGIWAEYLITSGNEAGLSVPDYVAFFADQPELKVIIIYVEATANPQKFAAACRMARAAGKEIVAVKLGQSEAGRTAAMAHTGSLAGSVQVFDALCGELGVIRADTLDDAVETTELLAHTGAPAGRRLGVITLSGAFRGLILDGAERNELALPALAPQTTDRLNAVLGVGSLVSNPIDGGFGVLTSAENYLASIEAMQADPGLDMLLLQEALPREAGSARAENYIAMVESCAAGGARKPIAFVTPVSHGQTDHSRALRARAPHVSFLQEANKALRAIASVARAREGERLATTADASNRSPTAAQAQAIAGMGARLDAQATALDEVESKDLLRAYGVLSPAEALVTSPTEALNAADRIGYPVVLKAVCATLTHKSDAGGVALNLSSRAEVAAEYEAMSDRLKLQQHPLAGALVCRQIRGGLELVLGLHRDPEMGLVVMAGSGGVLLELVRDVAFCVPPVSPQKARHMLARTRAGALMKGYRGRGPLDSEAVVAALVGLGHLAVDLENVIESIDINPFVALPQGQGGLALDALVVLRPAGGRA
ncbi:MAG TPA: acetate--CoA ligase family protein [Xanthobacteraceae bacterium]|nr:acetate--CoA ligase family protein [Xanthobacteraceae bacterium]